MKYKFNDKRKLWPEICTLLEAIVTKRYILGYGLVTDVLRGRYCCLKIINGSHIFRIISKNNQKLVDCIFEEQPIPSKPSFSPSYDNEYFQRLQQIVFGHAFERLLPEIKEKWPSINRPYWNREKAPAPIDFCFHIRNGCFHGNKFNIMSEVHGKTWREATIDKDINGQKVMGLNDGFLGLADVIVLMYDFENAVCR
ncbi:MAG: hypothetical protein PHR77_12130 [Kiritimatiellae bacterium]|nr:hypothetical protein [Kiritimatiellia bacterium]MDD5519496.1 hypothetical protein [Kiritimatiellia bacterium]